VKKEEDSEESVGQLGREGENWSNLERVSPWGRTPRHGEGSKEGTILSSAVQSAVSSKGRKGGGLATVSGGVGGPLAGAVGSPWEKKNRRGHEGLGPLLKKRSRWTHRWPVYMLEGPGENGGGPVSVWERAVDTNAAVPPCEKREKGKGAG